jgi:hypothetical protein
LLSLRTAGSALDNELAIDHEAEAVALFSLFQVMGSDQDGGAIVGEIVDHAPKVAPSEWVDTPGLARREIRRAAGVEWQPPRRHAVSGRQEDGGSAGYRDRTCSERSSLLSPARLLMPRAPGNSHRASCWQSSYRRPWLSEGRRFRRNGPRGAGRGLQRTLRTLSKAHRSRLQSTHLRAAGRTCGGNGVLTARWQMPEIFETMTFRAWGYRLAARPGRAGPIEVRD